MLKRLGICATPEDTLEETCKIQRELATFHIQGSNPIPSPMTHSCHCESTQIPKLILKKSDCQLRMVYWRTLRHALGRIWVIKTGMGGLQTKYFTMHKTFPASKLPPPSPPAVKLQQLCWSSMPYTSLAHSQLRSHCNVWTRRLSGSHPSHEFIYNSQMLTLGYLEFFLQNYP